MRWTRFSVIALVLFFGGLALAGEGLVFGPMIYESTSDEGNSYTETLEIESGGNFVLFVRNGDDETTRVSGLSISINGRSLIDAIELDETRGRRIPVELDAGAGELIVEVTGPQGSFVTLAIAAPHIRPRFTQGRLLLPWGRNDGERFLRLALKNGSLRFPRIFRVVFFSPDGRVAAASERIPIPPRGSLALSAEQLLGDSDWEFGSVEIYYTGPGVARMFGSARHTGLAGSDVQSLEQAGFSVFRAGSDK